MSYTHDREQFIDRMAREGLPPEVARTWLRCATTLQRLAELACSSEAADRDRIPCPATTDGPCLCDNVLHYTRGLGAGTEHHESIPRIALQEYRTTARAIAAAPGDWAVLTEGDPRGYVLRIIPPSYKDRNEGKDRHNLESIGVPARDSRLRF